MRQSGDIGLVAREMTGSVAHKMVNAAEFPAFTNGVQ